LSNDIKAFLNSTPASRQWEAIGTEHRHGICLPLFSLKTEKGNGIVLQLLPLYDSQGDPSPYSPVSAFALNPIYLSLNKLQNFDHSAIRRGLLSSLRSFNSNPRVDHKGIYQLKMEYLNDYILTEGNDLLNEESYQQWYRKSRDWVLPYALYKSLAELSGTVDWEIWREEWKNPRGQWEALYEKYRPLMEKHCLVQFLCHRQMKEVKNFADASGILIKGDCPILISRKSADVWANRHLFKLNYRAGAPPDDFNREGQDWGFPVYAWDSQSDALFSWWKNRLAALEPYCHLYRLDHVVGFYRIFALWNEDGTDRSGFIPEDHSLWISGGESRMKALLEASCMLPIGEDLGTVPEEVKTSLNSLGICGTKVLRWEKRQDNSDIYLPFEEYTPLSMSTVSTHDTETLAAWWKTHRKDAQAFSQLMGWNEYDDLTYDRYFQILKACHTTPSLFHINLIQEYLGLFKPLVFEDLNRERINTPGGSTEENWTYRTKPTIEEIMEHQGLREAMSELSK